MTSSLRKPAAVLCIGLVLSVGLAEPALAQLRWMIEEFRVSLHAQELRTLMPVSEKRLQEQIQRILHPQPP